LASRTPVMGMPQDLEREFDDAMSEIRAFEAKKRKE
jgi:lysophospholipid acyltransferase